MTDVPSSDDAQLEHDETTPEIPALDDVDGVVDFAPTAPSEEVSVGPPPPDPLLETIVERFADIGWDVSGDQLVALVPPENLIELAEWLRTEEHFDMCVDITAADYLEHWDRPMGTWQGDRTRFEVVANLLDLGSSERNARRLRLRVPIPEGDPNCPTLAFIWPLADPAEREIYDLFGIVFDGHPDLTRIMMPDDWEGHPLRKDYDLGRIPVTFGADASGSHKPTTAPVTFQIRPTGSSASGDV